MNEFLSLLSIVLLLFSFCSGCIQGHKAGLQSRDHTMTIISFFPPYRTFQSTIHNSNDIIFKSDFIVISRLFNKTDLIHQHQIILCMIYLCDNDIKGHPFIVIIYLYPNHHIGSVPAGTPTSETT